MENWQPLSMPHHWKELPGGEYYQQALQAQLAPWWPKITGLQLLKWGELSRDLVCPGCQVPHQVIYPLSENKVQSTPAMDKLPLPYPNHWFDACLLAHTLSYSDHPYELLQEADRLLTDQGWLLLSGFHALSWLGIGRRLPWVGRQQPYWCQLFNLGRVLDWLALLDYQIVHCRTFQIIPGNHSTANKWLERCLLPLGCQYLIIARKQITPLQPIQAIFPAPALWPDKSVGMSAGT